MPPLAPGEISVTVSAGDTVYALSRRYGVAVDAIIDANGLAAPYDLVVGQQIRLPRTHEHVVAEGETLQIIAGRYNVDVHTLASVNGLIAPYSLQAGQALTIPETSPAPAESEPTLARTDVPNSSDPTSVTGAPPIPTDDSGEPPPLPMTTAPAPPSAPAPSTAEVPPAPSTTAALPAKPSPSPSPPPPAAGSGFLWPVNGEIIAGFGPKPRGMHNDGINIAAARGTTVRASENGVVAYAGNELRGFGNLILVRHSDGWVTAYAHNDRLLVKRGDVVQKGQAIARVGNTGNVSTPQLHFQLRRGKTPVDPSRHLPKPT